MSKMQVTYVAELDFEESLKLHIAELHEFPGVMAYGKTPDEAVANIAEILKTDLRGVVAITASGPRPKPEFMAGVEQLDATKYRRVTIDITDLLPK